MAYGWVVTDHLPYSPNLALSDVHLFDPLKKNLGGKQFAADDDCRLLFLWLQHLTLLYSVPGYKTWCYAGRNV
jgi:hypothetical protein